MNEQLDLLATAPPAEDPEVIRLRALNDRLQAELADAAHWRPGTRKHRTARPTPPLDYGAWLAHADGCSTCTRAREDMAAARRGELEDDPVVACETGLRMMPLQELDTLTPGVDRGELAVGLRRLIAHSRRLEGREPDKHIGVAWSGGPIESEAAP